MSSGGAKRAAPAALVSTASATSGAVVRAGRVNGGPAPTPAASAHEGRSVDRRITRTRRKLQAAVVELSLDKGFQNITVDHILERAGITRTTFYAHFRDREQLLTSVAEQVIDDVLERFAGDPGERDGERVLLLFREAERQPDRLRVVLRGEGDGVAMRYFADRVTAIVMETDAIDARRRSLRPVADPELVARAYAGQLLSVLAWWLELDSPPPAGRVVAQLRDLFNHGRASTSQPSRPSNRPTTAEVHQ